MISFICSFIYFFTLPDKKIIFDRLNGTVTYPVKGHNADFVRLPFEKLKAYSYSYADEYDHGVRLIIKNPVDKRGSATVSWILDNDKAFELWSYYVWYMDKNRPLPPGEMLDTYREKDFGRRKKEGFPKPIYVSLIPTPEATPEQLKERQSYWNETFTYNYKEELQTIEFDVYSNAGIYPKSKMRLQEGTDQLSEGQEKKIYPFLSTAKALELPDNYNKVV